MAEKNPTKMRRETEGFGKQQDQVLRGVDDAPVIPNKKVQERLNYQRNKPKNEIGEARVLQDEQIGLIKTLPGRLNTRKAPQKTNDSQKTNNQPLTKNENRKDGKANNNVGKINNPRRQPNRQQSQVQAANQPANAPVQRQRTQKPAQSVQKPQKNNRNTKNRNSVNKPSIKAYFLGGLNEIGKNFTLFECNDDMIIVDCGLAFPSEDMLGIDIVIPDFSFVEKNADKIRGIFITHGHEDHIGAVAYLFKKIKVPLYATSLTVGLINGKLKEHGLAGSVKMHVTPAGSHVKLGCFDVESIHVNHSISDAVALAIHSPAGTIIHTGDFKIDCTPALDDMIDLARFAELGKEGVLALMADSTNAERAGYTQTEQKVNESLDALFSKSEGKRIIIATFASNTSRVQQIIDCAVKYRRKVALSGRSMLNVMGIASELGYLNVPDGILIDLNMINRYESGDVVLITTGSQGEPMSALARMASADHRQVELSENDVIIISARPIPGNEKTVGAIVDELMKRGCTVVYESMYEVHVSGHACQEELKIIHSLTRPKFFIPVHGEQKHLRKHAALAMSMGMDEKNIFIGNIGNVLEIQENSMKVLGDVPAGSVLVDGLGVGDVGSIVMRDRKHLAEDGIIIVVCSIDTATGELVSGPDIVSRGFVYVRESEALMDEAKKLVYNTLENCTRDGVRDWNSIKQNVRDALSRFLYGKTRRSPMILPIIMEV